MRPSSSAQIYNLLVANAPCRRIRKEEPQFLGPDGDFSFADLQLYRPNEPQCAHTIVIDDHAPAPAVLLISLIKSANNRRSCIAAAEYRPCLKAF
jgi:hypothetical protein